MNCQLILEITGENTQYYQVSKDRLRDDLHWILTRCSDDLKFSYRVTPHSCTCPHFLFRGRCKHMKALTQLGLFAEDFQCPTASDS